MRALVTGITGQDGSYLAELLLDKGYEVHGLVRSFTTDPSDNIRHLLGKVTLHQGDLTDSHSIERAVRESDPQEVYNLAAQSHVGESFKSPLHTIQTTGVGAVRVMEACRTLVPDARVYQASTSELFGSTPPPQDETTPMVVRSPYGAAKLLAHETARIHREAYGQFVACGILFNHESPRRHESFVTRKITSTVARIADGRASELRLGNLDARRDWGHARDFVEAMWLMLQQDQPDDIVIATGETHSVGDLVDAAFSAVGLDPAGWVVQDPEFMRPNEVDALWGDPTRAREVLGWKPTCTFNDLVAEMVEADMCDSRKAA